MSTTTYRFLQTKGRFNVFANPLNVIDTLSTAVSVFTPKGLKTQVSNVELALNRPFVITDDCDACKKETIMEAARLSLSGPSSELNSIRARVSEIAAFVASEEFVNNWKGFQTNPGTVIEITVGE